MNEQTIREGDQANSLRKVVSVNAPPEVAWRVFAEKMGTWWPLATHKIGKAQGGGRSDRAARRGSLVRARRRREHLRLGPCARLGTALAVGALLGDQRRLPVRPESEDGSGGALHHRGQGRHARRAWLRA